MPVACSGLEDLPPEGWDWLVETAASGSARGKINTLGALAISVPAIYRSKGYARLMIRALIDLAEAHGFCGLIAPVRPSAKSQHQRVPIDEYITWRDARGRPYDPWLRSHLASGGKLVGPCKRSMVVNEPLGFWENWTKTTFETSGDYDIEGALAPVRIDLERQQGRYEEPNIWVAYTAGNA